MGKEMGSSSGNIWKRRGSNTVGGEESEGGGRPWLGVGAVDTGGGR
jgi:hypothetical protein